MKVTLKLLHFETCCKVISLVKYLGTRLFSSLFNSQRGCLSLFAQRLPLKLCIMVKFSPMAKGLDCCCLKNSGKIKKNGNFKKSGGDVIVNRHLFAVIKVCLSWTLTQHPQEPSSHESIYQEKTPFKMYLKPSLPFYC